MRIFVKTKPGAKQETIAQLDAAHFEISVKEPPKQGKANHALMQCLADHFHVSLSHVRLVSGMTSRNKVFEIEV